MLDVEVARRAFPALNASHQVFFDNAGGSQVLGAVSTAIKDYLEETNVQLGASYDVAKKSTSIYNNGLEAAASFINATTEDVVLGSSTTQLFANLAQTLKFPPESEFIISKIDHEANISSWVRVAKLGNHRIKWWEPSLKADDGSLLLTVENLRPLMTSKTRFVACTHASNILGGIHDIKAIADCVHAMVPGCQLCVDGVAFAPHRSVDVRDLGVDYYSFSWYKVYGPHIAMLYASPTARSTLGSLGHYFHKSDSLTSKLGLASASYELVAALPNVVEYLNQTTGKEGEKWGAIAAHEEALQRVILDFLNANNACTIYGHKAFDRAKRIPVVSFTVDGWDSKDLVDKIEARSSFACRYGHFYSKRLVDDLLGLEEKQGVVRVSMVHYNTRKEIEDFVQTLQGVLAESR